MRAILLPLGALLALAGCSDESKPEEDTSGVAATDADLDGWTDDVDCDDSDPDVHPEAPEQCNGLDDDCDDLVDEDTPDADGDGTCDALDAEDCDGVDNDGDGAADEDYPDTDVDGVADCMDVEACDGVDNDGDGQVDEGMPDTDGDGTCDLLDSETCDGVDNDGDGEIDEDFLDNDGDGVVDCLDSEDCDGIDNDGDGFVDEGYRDTDGDDTADCMDTEECDGLDNDGDGAIDEEFADTDGDGTADCVDAEVCDGLDNDGDGEVDEGSADTDGDGTADCVDAEDCDGLDNDGDGSVDEGFDDTDRDGTADCMDSEECDGVDNDGDGSVDDGFTDTDGDGTADCMDSEECDGADNDGDGSVDEGQSDADGDGTCDAIDSEECDGVDNDGDGAIDEDTADADEDGTCDAFDTEECDGVDNDGDGLADEGYGDADGDGTADCVDVEECDGVDNDGDGLVDEGVSTDDDGDGWSECDGDCDDTEPSSYPGLAESIDGLDNDCDGFVDEDFVSYGDIVITELMIDPAAVNDTMGEYFEVYNAASFDIDLIGWTLHDDRTQSLEIDDSVVVPAGGFAVLGRAVSKATNGGVPVDYGYWLSFGFANTGADGTWLELDGAVIDGVDYDPTADWTVTTGVALELDEWEFDADANDDAAAWCDAVDEITAGGDLGTPSAANGLCGSIDHDGDGWTGDDGDCDDENPATYPGAPQTEAGVDNDCDGVVENTIPVAVPDWSNVDPVATCDEIELDGTASYDPDGDPIVGYEWSLVSAPSGSARATSDIDATTDATPVFSPDVDGTYTFGLVVSDGIDDSTEETVDVEVVDRGYNTDPVADAGRDSSYSETVTCTITGYGASCPDCSTVVFVLDGTGSSDADGDDLSYEWSTTSSYGSVSDPSAASTSIVVSGIPATYGSTTTETITVDLDVADCAGASDDDSMNIVFRCTGS